MLSERESQIFLHVVRSFIDTGQAVSSGAVSKTLNSRLSSASVRAVMAALEKRGLLHQAHTSAGRIPTLEAMRLYVRLVRDQPGRARKIPASLREALREPSQTEDVVRGASRLLSVVSSLAGLALGPQGSLSRLSHVELIGLSGQRALVVLVWQGEHVQHQVVSLEREVDPDCLGRMQRYLGEAMVGLTLPQARKKLAQEVRRERVRYDEMMAGALALGKEALGAQEPGEVYLEGELNLLEVGDFEDLRRIGEVLRTLQDKTLLRDILGQIDNKAHTHVRVGLLAQHTTEGGPSVGALQDCSMIVSPYRAGGQWLGWVGVVGPVRMQYKRLIPLVESAAQEITACLEGRRVA